MNKLNEKNIFLVDGIGALVTATIMGLILPALNQYIGMPLNVLYGLCGLGLVYAAYSLSCFFFANHDKPVFLMIIMWANFLYCPLTLVLTYLHFDQLTTLGVIYFIAEIPVLLGIVFIEWKVYQKKFGGA